MSTPPTPTPQMTFDAAPVANDTPVPMTFDASPVSQPLVVPAPAQTDPAATAAAPAATAGTLYSAPAISPVPEDTTLAGKVQTWAQNVSADLRTGSSITPVGSLLRSLSAHGFHGLDAGVSPAVAEFMGSLPLGLMQAVMGAAEVGQPGKRVQGAKDVAGGLAQAATIPSSIVAPEAGEAASQAVSTGAKAAAKPFAKVAAGLDPGSVQAPLQQALRDTVAHVAKDAGVTVNPASSVRDVLSDVADAVLAKSKGLYGQLDKATGGRFQRFDDALTNINRAIRDTTGLDDQAEAALIRRKAEVEASQQAAYDQARSAGVDPKLIEDASGAYKQGQALHDVAHNVRMATKGLRPELAGPGSTPETVNASQAFQRFSRLYDSGRLQTAVGSERAGSLLADIDQAFVSEQRIQNRVKAVKTAAKVAGIGAAAGGIGTAAKLVHDLP